MDFLCACSAEYKRKFDVWYASLRQFYPDATVYVVRQDKTEFPSECICFESTPDKMIWERHRFVTRCFDLGSEVVALMGVDIQIFSPLTEAEEEMETHEMLVTPHLTAPLPLDRILPDMPLMSLSTIINADFVIYRNTPRMRHYLEWFEELAEHGMIQDNKTHGMFLDQSIVTMLVGFVNCKVLRHAGYNVAYWNLPTRHVYKEEVWMVDGVPLRFMHFSGYINGPQLSKYNYRLITGEVLELFANYGQLIA